MNEPSRAPGDPGPRGTPDPVWVALARGAPDPAAAAGPSGAHEHRAPPEHSDCESWVRDKVLFLLHPERCLGTRGGPELSRDVDRDDGDGGCPSPAHAPAGRAAGGRGVDPAARAHLAEPAAPARSVLVRVVDYQVTQEVLRSAWTRGQMTTRTEERSMTAVTFRTGRE